MIYHLSIQRRKGVGREHAGNSDELYHGQARELPIVGKRFMVFWEGRQHDSRYLHTSAVKTVVPIEEDQRLVALIVYTQNTIYDVKISHTENE